MDELIISVSGLRGVVGDSLTAEVAARYAAAFAALAALRPVIDAFFDTVLVNDSDAALRDNRLALLAELRALFTRIADLSRLPG